MATVLVGSTLFVRAARPLRAGDELRANYFDVAVPLAQRRAAEEALGFEDGSRRNVIERQKNVRELHGQLHDAYEQLSDGCLSAEVCRLTFARRKPASRCDISFASRRKRCRSCTVCHVARFGAKHMRWPCREFPSQRKDMITTHQHRLHAMAMQKEMSDDARLLEMQAGFDRIAALVMRHEDLLVKLQLPADERQWLRASVINAHLYLLTFMDHLLGSRDAIQVRTLATLVRLRVVSPPQWHVLCGTLLKTQLSMLRPL